MVIPMHVSIVCLNFRICPLRNFDLYFVLAISSLISLYSKQYSVVNRNQYTNLLIILKTFASTALLLSTVWGRNFSLHKSKSIEKKVVDD